MPLSSNPGYLSRQMGHKNAKMFFEVYSKWIDGAANQIEKEKMRVLIQQHRSEARNSLCEALAV